MMDELPRNGFHVLSCKSEAWSWKFVRAYVRTFIRPSTTVTVNALGVRQTKITQHGTRTRNHGLKRSALCQIELTGWLPPRIEPAKQLPYDVAISLKPNIYLPMVPHDASRHIGNADTSELTTAGAYK